MAKPGVPNKNTGRESMPQEHTFHCALPKKPFPCLGVVSRHPKRQQLSCRVRVRAVGRVETARVCSVCIYVGIHMRAVSVSVATLSVARAVSHFDDVFGNLSTDFR